MKSRVLTIVTGFALCASTALASTTPPRQDPAARKDFQIFKDVADAINRYPQFTIFDDVSIEVHNGVATLVGKVTMPYKRNDIARRVENVTGVTTVQNRIEILPVSLFDDQLRARLARAIYGSPNFWDYAAMANPPIHIVVDRGRVTLTGVVRSEVDKALARSLAIGFGEFSVTNNLKTDAQVRDELEHIA
jgi:hyperosmotically inducible protein